MHYQHFVLPMLKQIKQCQITHRHPATCGNLIYEFVQTQEGGGGGYCLKAGQIHICKQSNTRHIPWGGGGDGCEVGGGGG